MSAETSSPEAQNTPKFELSTYEKAMRQVNGNADDSPALQERITKASERMNQAKASVERMSGKFDTQIATTLSKIPGLSNNMTAAPYNNTSFSVSSGDAYSQPSSSPEVFSAEWWKRITTGLQELDKTPTTDSAKLSNNQSTQAALQETNTGAEATKNKEMQERTAILDRLKGTTIEFWDKKFNIDPSKVTLEKTGPNYVIKSEQTGFGFIKTPLEVSPNGTLVTKEVKLEKPVFIPFGPPNWQYKLSQNGDNLKISKA